MKKTVILAAALTLGLLTACGQAPSAASSAPEAPASSLAESAAVADASAYAAPEEVVTPGMTAIPASSLRDGRYEIQVESSSSMFNITACTLTVENGRMTAAMTMGGTGYLYVYPGTAEEAAAAPEADLIAFEELPGGEHCFTVPVAALDAPVPCAAFSKKKELWYDRTLCFSADSLPLEAFAEGAVATAAGLGLEDGLYTVEVTLEGGSGRAGVESPAVLTVADGVCTATLVWSSDKYDFMMVDGEKFEPTFSGGHAVFTVPVSGFDYRMPVQADTVAMSTPHLIDYTLIFDSASIAPRAGN